MPGHLTPIGEPMHRFKKWRDTLQAASSPKAVVEVMENYVDSLPFSVLQTLPPSCVLALTTHPLDIQSVAVTFIQAELFLLADDERGQILHEVAHTFAAAATRVTALSQPLLATDD